MEKKLSIILTVIAFIGVITASISGYFFTKSWQFSNKSNSVSGEVIELIKKYDDSSYSYSPKVTYVVNGTDYTYNSKLFTKPSRFSVGEKTIVLYNPQQPNEATLKQWQEQYMGAGIGLLIGFIFFISGAIPLWLIKKRKDNINHLKMQGHTVTAKVTEVIKNNSLNVNGKTPWRILAQAHNPLTNTVDIFRSDNLWFDPSQFVTKDQTVTVYVDPQKPKSHYIDLSFLPKHNA